MSFDGVTVMQTYEYFLPDADAAMLAEELEDRDYYFKEANVFGVPEGARWEALCAAVKQTEIGGHDGPKYSQKK